MPTYEERLSAFEKTLAFMQREETISRDELNRNTTMLLGIVSAQQLDIKEIKIRLLSIDDRLNAVEERLTSLEGRFTSLEGRFTSLEEKVDRRFTTVESKLEQVLQLLTNRP